MAKKKKRKLNRTHFPRAENGYTKLDGSPASPNYGGRREPPGGPKVKFILTQEMFDEIMELVTTGKLITLKEVCRHYKTNTDVWYDALRRQKDESWLRVSLKNFKENLETTWIRMGLSGKVQAAPWIFCMKNIWGWKDRQDIHNTGEVRQVHSVDREYILKEALKAREQKAIEDKQKKETFEDA